MYRNPCRVAILLLAHVGVQNPEVWNSWAHSDPRHPIRLYAVCEKKPDHDVICRQHGMHTLQLRPSAWCHRNIAVNTLTALRAIAEKDKEISIIHVVSGYCLPMQAPRYFYTRHVLPPGHGEAGKTWYPFRTCLTANRLADDGVLDSMQWLSVTPRDVLSLRDDAELLDTVDSAHRDHCADESYIQTLLYRAGADIQYISTMFKVYTRPNAPSPIEWKPTSRRRRRIVYGACVPACVGSKYATMTAREILRTAHAWGYAFARKFLADPSLKSYKDLVQIMEETRGT